MKNINIKEKLKSENGLVFVEASIVFPVIFFILFFLIFFGNAYYEKAKIDDLVIEKSIEGSNYCADPMLETIYTTGSVPTLSNTKTEPYRYIFGGMDKIEDKISKEVQNSVSGNKQARFFNGMTPNITTSSNKIAKFNNYVIYSTFSVEITYTVNFPIRFLGSNSPTILKISSRAESPVNDTTEFIRNTDMVIDFMEGTIVGDKITEVFGKINDFISQFASK